MELTEPSCVRIIRLRRSQTVSWVSCNKQNDLEYDLEDKGQARPMTQAEGPGENARGHAIRTT